MDLLRELGYPDAWRGTGLLGEAFLAAQLETSRSWGGLGPGCLRYGGFLRLLERAVWRDEDVELYVRLARADQDPRVCELALRDLINHRGLTAAQLALVAPGVADLTQLNRHYRRTQLTRALRAVREGEPPGHDLEGQLPPDLVTFLSEQGGGRRSLHAAALSLLRSGLEP